MSCDCDTCTGKLCNHCGCKSERLPAGPHKSGVATTMIAYGQVAYASICCKCGEETAIYWPSTDPALNAAAVAYPWIGGNATLGDAVVLP